MSTANVVAHLVCHPPLRSKPHRVEPEIICAIKAIPILDVVGPYIQLRRSGKIFVGRCPWHISKSARSFSCNPQLNLWRCWSCNIGGDAISFMMRFHNISFRDAVGLLARKAGIPLDGCVSAEAENRIRLQAELQAVEKRTTEILHAEYLGAARELNATTKLRVRAGRRLQELIVGKPPRFRGEEELCWSALECASFALPRLDAEYMLLAFGTLSARESFCVAGPERRNEIINHILDDEVCQ